MDICELSLRKTCNRHPWEIARFYFVNKVIQTIVSDKCSKLSFLDIGCGDCYVGRELRLTYPQMEYMGIDTAMPHEFIHEQQLKGMRVVNSWSQLLKKHYHIVLMLDLLEHINDDLSFLKMVKNEWMDQDALLLITVPFHLFLFSDHDVFLGHIRRYSPNSLRSVVTNAGMLIKKEGQFFSLLFFSRLLHKIGNSFLVQNPKKDVTKGKGVAEWNHSKRMTDLLVTIMQIDCSYFNFLPGLSGYLVCSKK